MIFNDMFGMGIIEDRTMLMQVRFPRSKKNRINKKWKKNPNNYGPSNEIIQTARHFICHPIMADRIRKEFMG